jgi:putative sigma-54 modulation protein
MNIQFSGHNYEVTETEKEQILDGLAKLERHLGELDAVQVYFSKVRHLIKAEIQVSSRNIKLIGTGSTPDALVSIDTAIDRLIKQSGRYKKKRQDGRTRHEENGRGRTGGRIAAGSAPATEEEPGQIPVVKTEQYIAKPMALEDAIVQLNSSKAEFFIFRNIKNDHISVLYRRKGKSLGLIET